MKAIPYEHIDPELRDLVRILNATGCIATTGSCIGHGTNPTAEIVFKVTDQAGWQPILLQMLALSQRLDYSNIDVLEWHRLDVEGEYFADWLLRIEAHPRNCESILTEEERVLISKIRAIHSLIDEIQKWQELSPATSVFGHHLELPMQ